MPYSKSNGLKIYYEVSGEGFPFVMVHANPFDHNLWMYQIAHFSTYFRIIAPRRPRMARRQRAIARPTPRGEPALCQARRHRGRWGRRRTDTAHRRWPEVVLILPMRIT